MVSHSDVCARFADGKKTTAKRMFSRHDGPDGALRLYSYGSHFILAVRLKDSKAGIKYLLNGDTYSSSTSKHQGHARGACSPGVVIPFETLKDAMHRSGFRGHYEDITILDNTPDQYREVPYIDTNTGEEKTRTEHLLGSTLIRLGRKYFLSSIDDSAKSWGQGYFMVQLPGSCQTIERAYEMLRPKTIGPETPYVRQGEFFFEPKPELTTKGIVSMGLKPKPKPYRIERNTYTIGPDQKADWEAYMKDQKESGIYLDLKITWDGDKATVVKKIATGPTYQGNIIKGQNLPPYFPGQGDSGNPHIARDLMQTKDGRLFVRGGVRHPEHKMANLGDTWHRVHINRAKLSLSGGGRVD